MLQEHPGYLDEAPNMKSRPRSSGFQDFRVVLSGQVSRDSSGARYFPGNRYTVIKDTEEGPGRIQVARECPRFTQERR